MSDPAWYETVDSRVVHDGFARVRIDRVRVADGGTIEREVVEHGESVGVVPVTDEGTVLLLRQYRHPVGGYVLEIPAGMLDVEGEAVADAARRELAEEMHVAVRELRHLTLFRNSAGWTTERTHVYLGEGAAPTEPPDDFVPEAEEADLEVVALPFEEAIAAVVDGTITDAKTVIGLLLARERIG